MDKSSFRITSVCEKCNLPICSSQYDKHLSACLGKSKYPSWEKWRIVGTNTFKHPTGFIGSIDQVRNYIRENNLNGPKRVVGLNEPGVKFERKGYWESRIKNGTDFPWNRGKSVETHPELKDSLTAGGISAGLQCSSGQRIPGFYAWTISEEGRMHKSKWRKELHISNPETHPNRRLANNRSKMSYPERLIYDLLIDNKIDFVHQKKVDVYYADFTIDKIVIEIDGEKFHNIERDNNRDAVFIENGYEIHHFPVGKKRDLVQRVISFLKEKGIL